MMSAMRLSGCGSKAIAAAPQHGPPPAPHSLFPAPLGGEGAERTKSARRVRGIGEIMKNPSPGSLLAAARNEPPSPAGGEGFGACLVIRKDYGSFERRFLGHIWTPASRCCHRDRARCYHARLELPRRRLWRASAWSDGSRPFW